MAYFQANNKTYFFLHIPKTGGKMLEQVFSAVGLKSGHDIITSKPEGYSFTIVRNPFDRLVSCFFYLKDGGCHVGDAEDAARYDIPQNIFSDWIKLIATDPNYYFEQQHIMPMMTRIGKVEYFDRIALFENLREEAQWLYREVFDQDIQELPIVNQSKHKHFEEYYSRDTKNIVEKLYHDDIVLYEELKHAKAL